MRVVLIALLALAACSPKPEVKRATYVVPTNIIEFSHCAIYANEPPRDIPGDPIHCSVRQSGPDSTALEMNVGQGGCVINGGTGGVNNCGNH